MNENLKESLRKLRKESELEIDLLADQIYSYLATLWKESIDRRAKIKMKDYLKGADDQFLLTTSSEVASLMTLFKSKERLERLKHFNPRQLQILERYEEFVKIKKILDLCEAANTVEKGL